MNGVLGNYEVHSVDIFHLTKPSTSSNRIFANKTLIFRDAENADGH